MVVTGCPRSFAVSTTYPPCKIPQSVYVVTSHFVDSSKTRTQWERHSPESHLLTLYSCFAVVVDDVSFLFLDCHIRSTKKARAVTSDTEGSVNDINTNYMQQ